MHTKALVTIRTALLLGAGLALAVPVAAAPGGAPTTSCGGKKKDVKKPTDEDDKKPANPA